MTNEKKQNVAAKIRALLAKTEQAGCSEDEALAAIQKAQELMDKYAIDLTETELRAEPLSQQSAPSQGKHADMVRDFILSPIATYTNTRAWRSGFRTYESVFAGLESDVQFAHWLLDSLVTFVMRGADAAKRQGFDRRSFALGAASRIADRLRELSQARRAEAASHKSTGMELMIVTKRDMIEKWMKERGIKLKSSSSSTRGARDADARAAGHAYGDRANLNRPVGRATGGYLK